jgi:hypothetical protein
MKAIADSVIAGGGTAAAAFCGPSEEALMVQDRMYRVLQDHELDEAGFLTDAWTPLYLSSNREGSWYRFGATPKHKPACATFAILTFSFVNGLWGPPYIAVRMAWRVSIWCLWMQQLNLEPWAELGEGCARKTLVVICGPSHSKQVYPRQGGRFCLHCVTWCWV